MNGVAFIYFLCESNLQCKGCIKLNRHRHEKGFKFSAVNSMNTEFFFLITFIGYNTSDDNTYIYMEGK